VWLAGSLFVLIGLISYDPNDLAFFTSHPNSEIRNLCGVVGAWVAGVILIAVGWTGFLLPFIGMLWAIQQFAGQKTDRLGLRMVSTPIMLLALSALLSILVPKQMEAGFPPGGSLGWLLGERAIHYFGRWGAVVVLITLAILSLLVATEMTIWPLLKGLGKVVGRFHRFALKRVGQWVVAYLGLLFQKVRERTQEVKVHRVSMQANKTHPPSTAKVAVKESALPISDHTKTTVPIPSLKAESVLSSEVVSPSSSNPSQAPKTQTEEGDREKKVVQAERQSVPQSGTTFRIRPKEGSGQKTAFQLPPLDLLNPPISVGPQGPTRAMVETNARLLEETLKGFGIEARVKEVELGPVITRYELEPAPGVKIQKIATLSDDLALALKSASVRVIAPIPGKGRVGVEVPNPSPGIVSLREVLESEEFRRSNSKLTLAIGKDATGHPLVADLAGMPHLLIAGATGSGKTVCVNALILSILFQATPDEVRFLMVDPKMVELSVFNDLPHLLMPVVTDPKKVPAALDWVVDEMETRYRLFAKLGVRNIEIYHEKEAAQQLPKDEIPETLPYLVVIIDELADLMMVAQAEAERAIARLAHLSRAVGIHMVLATQRPSVDVLTGVIKANFPARIAFQVASRVDSRTVLDTIGAEKLLGKGDLIFMPPGSSKLVRAQGTWVADEEIERVVGFIKAQRPPSYEIQELKAMSERAVGGVDVEEDPLYEEAVRTVVEAGQASVSLLQRRMRLGYGRAARILDRMEQEGIVGPIRGAKPREVFLKQAQSALTVGSHRRGQEGASSQGGGG
jgi:S-DNA-T family DNA segregation ATPase FtsK/SpoIIIE